MTSTHIRPDNVGTSATIPDDICTIARITNKKDIVAWTTLDPVYRDGRIDRFTCCQHFGLCVIPCLWPHMLILSPCLLAGKVASDNAIESTYWILTVSELKIVVLSYNACCYREGDKVKSIPLDTITDCGTSAANTGCCGGCADVPTIYVDTASSGHLENGERHEAVGYALAGYDWFISEILSRRSTQYRGANHPIAISTINECLMDRGSSTTESSLENRILKLKEAQTLGMITDEEFEKKRLEIIASI